jgi:hypothetical protein
MAWNGSALVTDFSAELGDTSSAFQAKVLRWINDGIREIATSHQWPFLRKKGVAIVAADSDTAYLPIAPPSAPSLALLAGGSLTSGSVYTALVTYYDSVNGVETKAGVVSSSATPTGADLSLTVTIPISTSAQVNARKVYLKKDSGDYILAVTVLNNTSTSTTITADSSSTETPPDETYIHMLDGDPYIEGDRTLEGYTIQRMRFETNGVITTGTPQVWASIDQDNILVYPKPTSATTLQFYYFKLPAQVFNSATSQPQIPSWLYEDLYNYVMWRGYAYRDRDGKESKKINYEQGLRVSISRKGGSIKRSGRVRCMTGDSDGYVV